MGSRQQSIQEEIKSMSSSTSPTRRSSKHRQKKEQSKPKQDLPWPLSWLITFFFLPFFLVLGIYALFQVPQPDMPPSFYATLPAEKANRLEEEMELRYEIAQMEYKQYKKQREDIMKRADERHEPMSARGTVLSPKELKRHKDEMNEEAELHKDFMNQMYKKALTQSKVENVHFKQIKMYNKANKDWQKSLAETFVKRASATLAFVAACLLPALAFLRAGRGNSVWPVLRGFVLAAPLVSLLALFPWLPFEHPFFEQFLPEKIITTLLPPLANLHSFLITGYWTW